MHDKYSLEFNLQVVFGERGKLKLEL